MSNKLMKVLMQAKKTMFITTPHNIYNILYNILKFNMM